MGRLIKHTLTALAMIPLAVSCYKQEPSSVQQCTLTAHIEEDALTRTSISGNDADGYDILWKEGDTFSLKPIASSSAANSRTFTLIGGAGTTTGTFSSDEDIDWEIFYGAEALYGLDIDNPVWPQYQSCTAAGEIPVFPMRAYALQKETGVAPKLVFTNLGGLLRLTLKGLGTLRAVIIEAEEPMSGKVTAESLSRNYAAIDKTEGKTDIVLTAPEGIELSTEGTPIYIAMPRNADGYSSVVIYVVVNALTRTKKLKSGVTLVIEQSKITRATIDLEDSGDVEIDNFNMEDYVW